MILPLISLSLSITALFLPSNSHFHRTKKEASILNQCNRCDHMATRKVYDLDQNQVYNYFQMRAQTATKHLGCASSILSSPAEGQGISGHQNYTTIEELLAVVFACEKFQPYFLGLKVIVYMDHAVLTYLPVEISNAFIIGSLKQLCPSMAKKNKLQLQEQPFIANMNQFSEI